MGEKYNPHNYKIDRNSKKGKKYTVAGKHFLEEKQKFRIAQERNKHCSELEAEVMWEGTTNERKTT